MEGKKIKFAGAGPVGNGTPWGTLALVTRRALEPLGYETEIETASWGAENPRYVADGRCDLGATQYRVVRDAAAGGSAYQDEGSRRNLRLIATINQPSWLGVAIRRESGITDLAQVAERKLPLRVKIGGDRMFDILLDYYGLSRESIVAMGGTLIGSILSSQRTPGEITPWVKEGNFDAIIDPIYAAFPPEHMHWMEATILHDLQFQPLPDDLIRRICDEGEAEGPGFIPHRLMRHIYEDIPTVERFPQLIYTREEAPEDFIYEVTKTLDNSRHLFRKTHLPYSYDERNVARPHPVPLHDGAERYYNEVGYRKE